MFLAPLLAGLAGLGSVGTALLSAGVSLALGYAARKLAPQPRPQDFATFGARGQRLSLSMDPNAPRDIVFGKAAVAGTLVYRHVYGTNKSQLHLIYALADSECDSLAGIIVDGRPRSIDPGTGEISGFDGKMRVTFHDGAYGQAADSSLVSNSGGRWTSNDRGRGVCYVVVRLSYDEKIFASGVPRFLFIIKGAKLYDWRKDSTNGGSGAHRWGTASTYEWSDNPIVASYNWRRGIWVGDNRVAGMNTPASALPVADWTAAANACDEAVALKAGGTEKRYRVNGVVSTAEEHREVIRGFLTACAGREIDTGGILRPLPGVAQASVMTLTDDDLMLDSEIEITPKQARSDLVNAVFGSFHDPAQQYEGVALPPRLSSADETADGGIRLEQHYGLDYVTSHGQGQRILEIFRRRGRQQMQVQARFRSRLAVLESGDWVTWTSARYGFVAQTFEVASALPGDDLTTQLVLMETAATVYDFTAAIDEIDPLAPPDLPSADTGDTTVAGFAMANVTITGGDGASRPGLQATWTAIDDLKVLALKLEYRKVGDTVPLERRIENPQSGVYTWVDGVQGGVIYEARLLMVTEPPRPLEWTAWEAPATAAAPQVVAVAAEALYIDPSMIPPAILDAQSQFELSNLQDREGVAGALAQSSAESFDWAQRIAQANLNAAMAAAGTRAALRDEQIIRYDQDAVVAARVVTVETIANGATAKATEALESIDGIGASWGVVVDVNGYVLGSIRLDGSATGGSQFTILADRFGLYHPDANGGTPIAAVSIATVDNVTKLVLNGQLLADSIKAATGSFGTLSAISADLGIVTAGVLRSADNLFRIDLNAKEIVIETG